MAIDSGYWGNGAALDSGYWESGKDTNVPTNADHIRSMTDEELAEFLDDSNSQGCVCPTKDCEATCKQCIVNWLKQPYKGENK